MVDLGCGRLRNLDILLKHFPDVTLVDTELQCARISNLIPHQKPIRLLTTVEFEKSRSLYEAIFLISVLHVIDKPPIRTKIIQLAESKLRNGGYLIVDVPTGEAYYRRRCTLENTHGDGWVMGTGAVRTFYRSYSASKLDKLITVNTGLTLFKKLSVDHHIIRIWQRTRPKANEG